MVCGFCTLKIKTSPTRPKSRYQTGARVVCSRSGASHVKLSGVLFFIISGGSERIRTSEGLSPLTVFKTVPLNHSGTLPQRYYNRKGHDFHHGPSRI